MEIALNTIERAINHWRIVHPSRGEERALSPEVNALATVYALMIFQGVRSVLLDDLEPLARQLLENWVAQHTGT